MKIKRSTINQAQENAHHEFRKQLDVFDGRRVGKFTPKTEQTMEAGFDSGWHAAVAWFRSQGIEID